MDKNAYEQDMFSRLLAHDRECSGLQTADRVKFLFQGMLGGAHLLSAPERIVPSLQKEMDMLEADPQEALTQILSPGFMRINLRRAKAEHLTADQIGKLLLLSNRLSESVWGRKQPEWTREDVFEACERFSDSPGADGWKEETRAENMGQMIRNELTRLRDPSYLPSHSESYHEKYHPAYRVISAAWEPYLLLICRISRMLAQRDADAHTRKTGAGKRCLLTIDGPCATGKTTFAGFLSEIFDTEVIHTDEYVVPHSRKTPERLAVPGGNCDWERLTGELLIPWKQGRTGVYRRYACREDRFLPAEDFPDQDFLILEGSYCNLPDIRALADLRAFFEVSYEARIARLARRETEESLQRYYDRWIPLEDAYYAAYRLPDEEMIRVAGS